MKKLILILLAAVAFSCGDGSNRSSESGSERGIEENDAIQSDTMQMEADTSAAPGMDRQGGVDTTGTNRNP